MPSSRARRTGAAVVVLAAVGALPAAAHATTADCPAVPGARSVPSPTRVLGHALGASPLKPAEVDRYLHALDAASPRIHTAVAGRSVDGRPLRYALVGDPRTLRPTRLAAVARAARAVRAGHTGPASIRRALDGPALVWLGAGVHPNEPSGTAALLETLSRLASGRSCAVRRVLHGALAVVQPEQNPDGAAAGTRTNASGFDLNRDWFAATQPETRAKIALLRRYPPTITVDEHEQSGTTYFVPPYAEPLLRGLPPRIRGLADDRVARDATRALRRDGARVVHSTGYDLLYPGYADSATSLLFGSGGMTFEQGSDAPLPLRVADHRVAARAVLRSVAARHDELIRGWASGFRSAEREGAAGRSGGTGTTYGWILRTDRHAADARAVARRLAADGVRVRVLDRVTRVRRVDPVGPAPTASARLPAGTIVIPADQPLRRWLQVLLSEDADESGDAAIGEDTWSVPRMAGIDAAVLRSPVPRASLTTRDRVPPPPGVWMGGTAAFAGDTAAGARLALGLLEAGRPVRRSPIGNYRTGLDATLVRRASAAGIALQPVHPLSRSVRDRALRDPQVALVADQGPPLTGPPKSLPAGERPSGWVQAGLRHLGARVRTVGPDALAGGLPSGTTDLVLGPGALPPGGLSPTARGQVDQFVTGGGTLIVLGATGVQAAVQAGLSRVRTSPAPIRNAVSIAARPDPRTRIGLAVGGVTGVVVNGEPRLEAPSGAQVALGARTGRKLAPSGPVVAAAGLGGRPLVIDERHGSGHVVTLGFSPLFRGQTPGGARVLAAILLPGGG